MPYKCPEKQKAYRKAYYEANKETIAAKSKAYQKANKEAINAKQKTYNETNKDAINAYKRAYRETNKDAINAYARAYTASDKSRECRLKHKYGITLEDYREMRDQQNGCCAICNQDCKSGKRLAVDHCHDTGVVRGLLCFGCNSAIGKLGDNVAGVQRALDYLKKTEVSDAL